MDELTDRYIYIWIDSGIDEWKWMEGQLNRMMNKLVVYLLTVVV